MQKHDNILILINMFAQVIFIKEKYIYKIFEMPLVSFLVILVFFPKKCFELFNTMISSIHSVDIPTISTKLTIIFMDMQF